MAVILGSFAYEDIEEELFPALKVLWETNRAGYELVKPIVGILLRYDIRSRLFSYWEAHNYDFPLDDEYGIPMIWPKEK